MIKIELKDGQSGYDAVGEYIRRYWSHNLVDTVVVFLGTSHDGKSYDMRKEIAYPVSSYDIEFVYDWWEGEKFIWLVGIKSITKLDVSGGIYKEQE